MGQQCAECDGDSMGNFDRGSIVCESFQDGPIFKFGNVRIHRVVETDEAALDELGTANACLELGA